MRTTVPRNRISLKQRLRTECLPELGGKAKYFHIRNVRAWLKAKGLACEDTTVKQYMSELMAGGFIHDAGKGWYSTIQTAFVLDAQPLRDVIALLVGKFPLLRFGCWSTEQIQGYTHHTLNKFVTFVHVGRDAMRPVFETLRGAGWNAYANPGAEQVRTVFAVRDRTAVVRCIRTPDSLPDDHRFPIEDMLLELHRECKRLSIMDLGDQKTVVARVLETGRIDMGTLALMVAQAKASDLGAMIGEYTILENDRVSRMVYCESYMIAEKCFTSG